MTLFEILNLNKELLELLAEMGSKPDDVQTDLRLSPYAQTERPNEVCQAHSHENSCDIFPKHQIL